MATSQPPHQELGRPPMFVRVVLRILCIKLPGPPDMDRYNAIRRDSARLDSLFENTVKNWKQIIAARVKMLDNTTNTILLRLSSIAQITSHFKSREDAKNKPSRIH